VYDVSTTEPEGTLAVEISGSDNEDELQWYDEDQYEIVLLKKANESKLSEENNNIVQSVVDFINTTEDDTVLDLYKQYIDRQGNISAKEAQRRLVDLVKSEGGIRGEIYRSEIYRSETKLSEEDWNKLEEAKLKEVSINEPAGFKKCVDKGGRVRTVSGEKEHGLDSDEHVKYCFIDGNSYRGEVHKKENEDKVDEEEINVEESITSQEITNVIYDTLMQNRQYPQLDLEKVEDQDVDARIGNISFVYDGTGVVVDVRTSVVNESKVTTNESTDLRIKEAITRAEKEKALEVIEELTEKFSNLKNQTSESKMKFKMLMKKLKEATSVYDEVNALRTKLEEKAKDAHCLMEANELLKTEIKEVTNKRKADIAELAESHKKSVETIKKVTENKVKELKESYDKKVKEGKEQGLKEGISKILKEYFKCKLAEMDLSIGQNTRALLEGCESIKEVDDILDKTKDIRRRNALHSESITEIRIDRNQQIDSEQARINKEVGSVLKGMS